MKIEMVLPSLAGAGMETMVARMARKLAARGHQCGVTCILEKGTLAEALEADGVRVSLVHTPGVLANINPAPLTAHIAALAPDVVHVHSGAWTKGAMAARQAGRRFTVLTAHGFVNRESMASKAIDRAAFWVADHIVAVTGPVQELLLSRGADPNKVSIIINGIDTQMFAPRPPSGVVRHRMGIGSSTMLIGCVARLETIKNHALLIDGLARARSQGVDCALVLFGDGSLRRVLEAQAASLGLGDRVHFWGFDAATQELYCDLDVFALTSTAEGTSISMLEAMASGVCCVATAVGGNVGLLDEGRAGVLVPSGNRERLAQEIVALAEHPVRRATLGRLARERAVAEFGEDAMIDRYMQLYEAGIEKRAAQ